LRDIALKAAAAFMFCDIGYIAYFNSFYGEAPQLVLFLLSAALGIRIIRNKGSVWNGVFFCMALVAFAWTKFANIPAAMLTLALTGVPMFLIYSKDAGKAGITGAICLSFALLVGIWSIVPEWMELHTNYNAVFFGILREEEASQQALEELGLPEYMAGLSGTTYYSALAAPVISTRRFTEDFSKLSKGRIAIYYLRHPSKLAEKLKITAMHSGFIRPPYLSNRNATYTRLTFDYSFSMWEQIRKKLPFDTIWFNGLICCVFTLLCTGSVLTKRKKHEGKAAAFMEATLVMSLLGVTVYSFAIPVISNGEADLAKHMFAFVSAIDLMILITLSMLVNRIPAVTSLNFVKAAASAVMLLVIVAFMLDSVYPVQRKPFYYSEARKGKIEVLDYIELGIYKGSKLLWQVIGEDEESYLLLCSTSIGCLPFSVPLKEDGFGSNLWTDSWLRTWLNNVFINAFDKDEKELIMSCENKYLLSLGNIQLKKGGNKDFIWIHIPELADRGYDSACYGLAEDRVFLPDIREIAQARRAGADIRRNLPYWLETPYFYDISMVRTVFPDGYIYMKDAAVENIGVVPAVKISKAALLSSRSEPRDYITGVE